MKGCSIEGCTREHCARGWCHLHYYRWRNNGDPLGARVASLMERLLSRIEIDIASGCWIWHGSRTPEGYGKIQAQADRKTLLVHRVAYSNLVGPIPEGLTLDHLCRVRACCNPEHLEPVTMRENNLRGVGAAAQAARRAVCPLCAGPYSVRKSGGGKTQRFCRPCSNTADKRSQAARRAVRRAALTILGALMLGSCQIPGSWYVDEGGTLRKGPKPTACASSAFAAEDGTVVKFDTVCYRLDGTEILPGDADWDDGVMGAL